MLKQTIGGIVTPVSKIQSTKVDNLISDIYKLCNERCLTIFEYKQMLNKLNDFENNAVILFKKQRENSISNIEQTPNYTSVIIE